VTEQSIENLPIASCCSAEQQTTCCEAADKDACCGTTSAGGGCGCSAGEALPHTDADLREVVRERYAASARAVSTGGGGCCGSDAAVITDDQAEVFGAGLYGGDERGELPDTALLASLGCGNPTAVAELREGETVLDLGSGGGIDVLLSARRVGPTGKAYGLDMTDEMLELARANQAKAGIDNVEWVQGHIEDIPLADDSVDVVLSNCVINLSVDKQQVLREAARVLKPGGRFAVSDVVADTTMDDQTRSDLARYVGCVAGALTRDEYVRHLAAAGLIDIEIQETNRVHEHAASAIVRARKPEPSSGVPCSPETT
jgi:SAM-dependent methyltransferase